MPGNTDDTVLIAPRRRRRWPAAAGAALLAAGLGGGAAFLLSRPAPPLPLPGQVEAPGERVLLADEAAIRAHAATTLTVFRFAPNPAIVVLDFPTLGEQARMFNRMAAWVEKAGQPRDRLLADAELDAAIRLDGGNPDTYYYGHDYRAADVRRFFALADRDKVALTDGEERLRRLLAQLSADPQGFGAVVSVPRAGPPSLDATGLDAAGRAAILRHELSHGEYFTNAAYARAMVTAWDTVLTEAERAAFRAFLASEGYDARLEDLMANETQAYLLHTPAGQFFDEGQLGIAPLRLQAIRGAYGAMMPPGWLRDAAGAPNVAAPAGGVRP